MGAKLRKSRGAFVEVPYFLGKYYPDTLRFYSAAMAPETRDTEACTALPSAPLGTGSAGRRAERAAGGATLPAPAPLFRKLDESMVEEEYARLAG